MRRLRSQGPERERALADLRDLLLSAARFEVRQRSAGMPHLRGGDHDDLAQQSADDALLAILAKLDDFRGESRFTTWAYKFALLEAAVKLRRRAWQEREVPLDAEHWTLIADHRSALEHDVERAELLRVIGEAIAGELTAHQREILVAITLSGVPIDVLAERLNTTRGALYKTLHDADASCAPVWPNRVDTGSLPDRGAPRVLTNTSTATICWRACSDRPTPRSPARSASSTSTATSNWSSPGQTPTARCRACGRTWKAAPLVVKTTKACARTSPTRTPRAETAGAATVNVAYAMLGARGTPERREEVCGGGSQRATRGTRRARHRRQQRARARDGVALAAAGADVALLARRGPDLDEAARDVGAHGRRGLALAVDLADDAAVVAAVTRVQEEFGGIDVVVNAAATDAPGRVEDLDVAAWDRVLAVNLRAPFLLAKLLLSMRRRGGGTVINVSSVAGKRGWANAAAYCASKFALTGLTQALAAEGRDDGIRARAQWPPSGESGRPWSAREAPPRCRPPTSRYRPNV